MHEKLTLTEAERCIRQRIEPTDSQRISLLEAVDRVTSTSLYARDNSPPFAKSAYDGYVIGRQAADDRGEKSIYKISGEIAAGESVQTELRQGASYRIMTGAPVPRRAWKVIPQENCFVAGELLSVSSSELLRGSSRILKKGKFIRKGTLLVRKGTCLNPTHLGLLAEAGIDKVDVHRRPQVGIFSSGSELTSRPERREGVETISSNRFLLAGLVGQGGCRLTDYGIVADTVNGLREIFRKVKSKGVDVLISTGGTGPGKYDLLKESFLLEGGTIIFSSLRLRPGKSAFFGVLGNTLHFGLPGPPAAVQPLFQVLIYPALRALQGRQRWRIPLLKARLTEGIDLGRSGPMVLRQAVLSFNNGESLVRLCSKKEAADCYLCCPPGRRRFPEGVVLSVIPMSGCSFTPET